METPGQLRQSRKQANAQQDALTRRISVSTAASQVEANR